MNKFKVRSYIIEYEYSRDIEYSSVTKIISETRKHYAK